MPFEHIPDRRHTGSLKWDKFPSLTPYWVADMDFASPEPIVSALHNRADHKVFGYAWPKPGFVEILRHYLESRHSITDAAPEWFVHLPGCVSALSLATRMACQSPGDTVLTCTPVYPPFLHVHADARANLVAVPHTMIDGKWTFDRPALEAAVTPSTRIFLLSNPQNPLGRVFNEEEILWLANFCERHDLILCSDEIHCDLILDPKLQHYSALRLPAPLRARSITLMAPSKTYNVAGLAYAFAAIPNPALRQKFEQARGCTMSEINCMGYAAAHAAYEYCEPWRKRLVETLRAHRDELYEFVQHHMPAIKIHPMDATYLAWLDCSALGFDNPQEFFARTAHINLSSGAPFGSPQHVRFNFGTSRAHMLAGLQKMASALQAR